MGQQGFRRPGSMIAKIVDDEIKKIAKKEGKSYKMIWYKQRVPKLCSKH